MGNRGRSLNFSNLRLATHPIHTGDNQAFTHLIDPVASTTYVGRIPHCEGTPGINEPILASLLVNVPLNHY
jgi:hypothetical protein